MFRWYLKTLHVKRGLPSVPVATQFRSSCVNLGRDGNFSFHLMIQVVPFENSLKAGSVAMDSSRTSAVPGYRQKGETVQAARELDESTKNLWPLEQRGEVKMCCHVDDRQKSCRFRAGEVL